MLLGAFGRDWLRTGSRRACPFGIIAAKAAMPKRLGRLYNPLVFAIPLSGPDKKKTARSGLLLGAFGRDWLRTGSRRACPFGIIAARAAMPKRLGRLYNPLVFAIPLSGPDKKKDCEGSLFFYLVEREGFEPSIRCRIHAFQACSFSRSDTSPGCLCYCTGSWPVRYTRLGMDYKWLVGYDRQQRDLGCGYYVLFGVGAEVAAADVCANGWSAACVARLTACFGAKSFASCLLV